MPRFRPGCSRVFGRRFLVRCGAGILLVSGPVGLVAGGPKYVAGASFFNPAVAGRPVHWAHGQVNYYVDLGPLNGSINNQQATAMVVNGFIEPVTKTLPMEYAVELSRLIELNMEGSVG